MPGTYTNIVLHFVFSTKRRDPWITPDLEPRLFPFIGGIIRDEQGSLLCIGGMPDHVHLLVKWRTDTTIADLMREVKSRSSGWVHATWPDRKAFAWQEGYAAFSVSRSVEDKVRHYIQTQKEHHASRDFKDELRELPALHGVNFDERYLFD